MPNPWDVPELSQPDVDQDKLYNSVGRALSAWEGLEHHLATFFGFFASDGSDSHAAARRAYGAVIAFQGRSSMLAAAAEIYFAYHQDDALACRFDDLLKKAANFAARRNEIAHGIVRPTFGPADPETLLKDISPLGWVLLPSDYATNKNKLLLDSEQRAFGFFPKYIYSSTEISSLATHFRALEKEAFDLMLDWGHAHPESWPAPRI